MSDQELREKMENGTMYDDAAEILVKRRGIAYNLQTEYNSSYGQQLSIRCKILRKMFKSVGENVHFERGLYVEFGWNVSIGNDFYGNVDMVILDGATVNIGNHVYIGPKCGLYATNHAIDAEERRNNGVCSAPINIGNNVWLGGNVSVVSGVTIGDGTIIGAGSVVTKDIPSNVIAAGNPCRVIRPITENDKTGYIKTEFNASYDF
jgi:maltose O-acetyltransferase